MICERCGSDKSERPPRFKSVGVRLSLLRQRDGDACWICGLDCLFDLAWNDEAMATVDHVVPRGAEFKGCDCPMNMKLAHRYCNMKRGCAHAADKIATMRLRGCGKHMAKVLACRAVRAADGPSASA